MNTSKLMISTFVVAALCVSVVQAQSVQPSQARIVLENQLVGLDAQKKALVAQLQNAENALQDLIKIRDAALEKQDSIGVSAESFSEIIKTLQSQRIHLTIDLAGLDARRDALAKAKAEMEDRNVDNFLAPLRELLLLEKKTLDQKRQLFEQAVTSEADVLAAKKKVLAVEVQIAEATARQRNSNFASQINSDLLNASLERAEKQARLEITDSLLNKFTQSRKLIKEATSTDIRISNGRMEIEMLSSQVSDLSSQIDQIKSRLSKEN